MALDSSPKDSRAVGLILSSGVRRLLASAIVIFLLLLMAGALSIPFLFESPSMWYKFGIDRILLRSGKLLGVAAGMLLFLQLPLGGRFKLLDRIFSLPGIIRQHRCHAWLIALMALAHPLCVLLSDGKLTIPLEMRYWPEWIGVSLLALILLLFVCSQWRPKLSIPFHIWMIFHRLGGSLILLLLVVHVLYVSETFDQPGLPRTAALLCAGILLLMWLWIRARWQWEKRRQFTVATVTPTGEDCTRVDLAPPDQYRFAYVPGQFVFVSFRSRRVSREPHAFTLSSTPSRPGILQLTIRASGDWSRTVRHLSPGEEALVQGPFGRFGHLFTAPDKELIMIAGGIGITPMLSMLRYLADHDDPRPVTLIWSNRSRGRVVCADEMDALAAKLTGLRWIPVFTREISSGIQGQRLNLELLEETLKGCTPEAAIFICGPPTMIRQVSGYLKELGVPAHFIFTERFGL